MTYPKPPTNPRTGRPVRERIAIYGGPKVGKSHQVLTIARWHQNLGSDAMFRIISTDLAYEVLLTNPEFADLENVIYRDVLTFQEYLNAAREFNAAAKSNDWLVGDLHSDAWQLVQDEYADATARKAGSKEIADLGDLWKTEGPGEYPIKGWEWGMPNARYRRLANNELVRSPCHVLLVYEEKDLPIESDKEDIKRLRETFKHIGTMPGGQKGDPFRWHSILYLKGNGPKSQLIATAAERAGSREYMGQRMSNGKVRPVQLDDFFMDYLVGVAGWEMG